MLDAINDDDTDQQAEEIETPTAEEIEDESVTQEVQNSIGMWFIVCTHCTQTHNFALTHAPIIKKYIIYKTKTAPVTLPFLTLLLPI